MKTLIENGKIITPYEVLEGYSLLIEDGKIKDINKEETFKGEFHKVIDAQGDFISPGFIDIHNHGNSGYDIMDSTKEALDAMGRYHGKNGVTAYLGTVITSSYEDIVKSIKNIVDYENDNTKSNLLGIHLEGPFFNIIKKGAQPEEFIKLPDNKNIEEIVELSNGKLKMVSLAPELEGALDMIYYLKENNVPVAMAHTDASYDEAKQGISYGATIVTHLYNGMRNFSHREPGIIGAALLDDRVFCEIIYDRIHLHDAAVEMAIKLKGPDKIVLVSDAMRAAGLEDDIYELGGQKVIVKEGAARLESGSLAGSTLNLQQAVYNMVNYLDLPIYHVVRMASLSPAKAINVDKTKGSIEIGKDGDIIFFNKDIEIKRVFVGGIEI